MTVIPQQAQGAHRKALEGQLRAVLPPLGVDCLGSLFTVKGTRNEFFSDLSTMAARALELDGGGEHVYFSTGAFAPDANGRAARDRAHLASRKCLHLDIDIAPDEGGKYSGVGNAISALRAFALENKLVRGSTVVCSGRGLHLYWCFDEAVDVARWTSTATKLKELCQRSGILADHPVTADGTRLLRPVGTHNRKLSGKPAPVFVAGYEFKGAKEWRGDGWPTVPFGELSAALDEGLARGTGADRGEMLTVLSSTSEAGPSLATLGNATSNDALTAGTSLAPRDESTGNVAWVRARLDAIPADCERSTWFQTVTAIKSTGWSCAHELAESWSRRAPDKFDAHEFAKLWNSVHADGGITLGTLDAIAKRHGFKTTAPLDEHPRGSDGWHAERFARMFAGRLAYVHASGVWVHLNGLHWERCEAGEATRYALEYAKAVKREAAALVEAREASDAVAQQAYKDACRVANHKPMQSILSIAGSLPSVAMGSMADFDADDWMLGVANGAVDLRTGSFLAPHPDMRIMRHTRAKFDREAAYPGWLKFLGDVFCGDAETIDYMQRFCGYCLTGDVTAEAAHWLHGYGRNGKSVFFNVLYHVMGGYAIQASSGLLAMDPKGYKGPNPDMARLAGARLIGVNETQQGERLDEVALKSAVSTEPVTTRDLYGKMFTFKPTGKLLIRTNHKPIVTGTDDGVWRRVRLVPFERQFSEEESDDGLAFKLMAEADGILQWMLEGLEKWKRDKLKPSGAIKRAGTAYRKDMDIVGNWLDDNMRTDDASAGISQGAAYADYQRYCELNGMRANSANSLSRELERRGITRERRKVDGKRGTCYVGLSLGSPAEA